MFGLLTRTVCYLVNPIFKILDYIGYGNSVALLLTIYFGLKLFGFIANRIMTKHPETFILFMFGYLYLFGFVALASVIIWISFLE